MQWNADQDNRLRALWAEGLSASAIGARMGVSKNAVIGRANRLDLPGRQSPVKAGRAWLTPERLALMQRMRAEGATVPEIRAAAALLPGLPLATPRAIREVLGGSGHRVVRRPPPTPVRTLPRLPSIPRAPQQPAPPPEPRMPRAPTCCWPLWGDEPPTLRFCDSPHVVGGSSYCPEHHRIAYRRCAPDYLPPIKGFGPNDRAAPVF